jgi:hypothetical protein
MTKVSFKKFSNFVDSSEELSDDQICEIFGFFKNNVEADKLKAAKASLTADQIAKKKAADKAAADKIAKMRQVATGQDKEDGDVTLSPAEKIKAAAKAKLNATSGNQMRGAQARAAERNWALGESVKTDKEIAEFRTVLQEILKDQDKTGGKYYYKVYNKPVSKLEKLAATYLQNLYSQIAIDKHLHEDDDFEKIEELLFKKLEKLLK